jgi:transcriptional regulator with XRE-family HTH domain
MNLKKLRLREDRTLEELANILNISKQAVDSHERGFNDGLGIRVSILEKHLGALGYSLRLVAISPTGEEVELSADEKSA